MGRELKIYSGRNRPDLTPVYLLFQRLTGTLTTVEKVYHHDAEKRIVKALPKVIKAVSNEDLREALSSHLEETKGHVSRIEEIFESLDMPAKGKPCDGMKGILTEGSEVLGELEEAPVIDAAAVASAQRVLKDSARGARSRAFDGSTALSAAGGP